MATPKGARLKAKDKLELPPSSYPFYTENSSYLFHLWGMGSKAKEAPFGASLAFLVLLLTFGFFCDRLLTKQGKELFFEVAFCFVNTFSFQGERVLFIVAEVLF